MAPNPSITQSTGVLRITSARRQAVPALIKAPVTSQAGMTPAPPDPWLIAVDRGGTFTDCCATDPSGLTHRAKLLSSGRLRAAVSLPVSKGITSALAIPLATLYPTGFFGNWTAELFHPDFPATVVWRAAVHDSGAGQVTFLSHLPDHLPPGTFLELYTGEPAPVVGARLLTGTRLGQPFPPHRFRLATTLATNALLENQGAAVAFFVTRGFRDLLTIGDQRRADLFALHHQRDRPLHRHTVEVIERLDSSGSVLVPPDSEALASQAAALVGQGVHTAAVALAHSDLNPAHERAVREILITAGFTSVSLSSELSAQIKLLPRAQTAVVDAALAPVMSTFIQRVRAALGPSCMEFHCLTSAGGLAEPGSFYAKDSLLSGPAGGLAGSAAAARRAGIGKILTIDMGGTSTDVARWEGEFLYQFEQRLGQATILAPSLRIETVAAGGGSICSVSAGALTVGPRSSGADPGPACYGRGGPLTLTDVNLLLGRLDPDKASIPLHRAPALAALASLKQDMAAGGLPVPGEDYILLQGLLQIAIGRMAEAVRSISVRDGCDPTADTLLAFGGAGPQHACLIAEELGITQILVPAGAGLLSAAGAASAQPERFGSRQILQPLSDTVWLASLLTELENETLAALAHPGGTVRQRLADLRLQGQDTALTLPFDDPAQLTSAFNSRFQQLYGYAPPPHRTIEVVSLRVITSPPEPAPTPETFPQQPTREAASTPQVIQDHFSTLILEPGWSATQGTAASWLLTRTAAPLRSSPKSCSTHPPKAEAAIAELFRCRFQGMVDAMGELLRRTSVSTNVKERLDYSCALLDANGHLLVNAPHIPVHLGALGECVRRTTALIPPSPGDMLVTNDPAFGGSHLPDVTVICPVFGPSGQLLAYTANRAHHAEIGGITPGSMPAYAKNLAEEGVVIAPAWLVKNNISQEENIAHLLTTAPHPTRCLPDNLADLRAQAAAAHHGATALLSLCQTHDSPAVVGGNVETSQRIVEVLVAALGLQAASQGTMNNVIFGDASFGHYETVCGGTGAGPGYPGTDAIHSHMTNTAITDIEILERRYPVRIGEFSIRPGSGGGGRFPGGRGTIRTYQFLAPLTLSLLTEHRSIPPPGHAGGQSGACGEQFLILPNGTRLDLPATVSLAVDPGTTLHLHTPGGGGWG